MKFYHEQRRQELRLAAVNNEQRRNLSQPSDELKVDMGTQTDELVGRGQMVDVGVQVKLIEEQAEQITQVADARVQMISPVAQEQEESNVEMEAATDWTMANEDSASNISSNQQPNRRTTYSWRGSCSSIAVEEPDGSCRVYRRTTLRGTRAYYRCSKCETLNRKSGVIFRPKLLTVNGQIVGNPYPEHHAECRSFSESDLRAQEIDISCRNEIRLGIAEPRQAWERGRRIAFIETYKGNRSLNGSLKDLVYKFPRFENVRRAYNKARREKVPSRRHRSDMSPEHQESNASSVSGAEKL